MRETWELLCPRELAERLGAISPVTIDHHRRLHLAGHMLVRDYVTNWPMFWPIVPQEATAGSSQREIG